MVASAGADGNMKRPPSDDPDPRERAGLPETSTAARGPSDSALLAHDVRNLLAVALGNVEFLEAEGGQEFAQRLRAVRRPLVKAGMLCEEMLAAEAGARPAPFEDVDLGTVAHSACADFHARAGDAVRVQVAGPDGRTIVRGRLQELTRAVLNLMWNALDAMEDARVHPLRLDLAWGRDARGAWLELRDYGPGLTPQQLTELSRPFRSTHADGRVRGLGLPGVQRILRVHGGALSASPPAAGPGTVMRMQFGVQKELEFGA